ncbi:hypothetical protein L596_018153 [Steinernema carpocapsae]|uniref:Uncharacterized protein n=1 Tax=Steinernema carpocapsae TaxID=34508 RepID=A0A4U5N455_STECR|nr:hypothetical protein L596_018153 [Steinernema carpocapsae]
MSPNSKRIDIEALAVEFDKKMASVNAEKAIDDARLECLQAIEMLRKANEAAQLSEEYVKNSQALIMEEIREMRVEFDQHFTEDYKEIQQIKADFEQKAAPIVEDISCLKKKIHQAHVDIEALQSASGMFTASIEDLKSMLDERDSTQQEIDECSQKLTRLDDMSRVLLKRGKAPAHTSSEEILSQIQAKYYGTVEGSVLIPQAFQAVMNLNKELTKVCNVFGEGLEEVDLFRMLTSELRDSLLQQVNLIRTTQRSLTSTTSEAKSATVSTAKLRVPFIDELSTIMMKPTEETSETCIEASEISVEAGFSDLDISSSTTDYLTSVES